ncbi:MAG: ABC transporter ATP-binding protein [Akkermansia sp.]|nr:ABC transporter ATP-binding protein [Akkermansia sp.]MBQ7022495.1 ABC transporter ATP-binding protein [Akkermansia sp.]
MSANILDVSKLSMHFPVQGNLLSRKRSIVKAVDDVSFTIAPGETLGLVGESGCGKSTIGRCIVRLLEPTDGCIRLMGKDVTHRSQWRLGDMRRHVQMVFQDPAASLDPRMDVRHIIAEPLQVQGTGTRQFRRERVNTLLDLVGLPQTAATKFPHEFSGGQRQRIGIARALALNPKLLVLDEPVSALDVSVQSQVLNLLLDLQRELGLSYLFISHDLSVVRHMADRVAVMYLGKIVEMGESDLIYHDPRHAYTRALISAIPMPDPTRINHSAVLPGDVPSPIDPLPGSAFGRRISHPYLEATYGMDLTPVEIEPGHWVAPDPCAISLSDLARLGIDIYQ